MNRTRFVIATLAAIFLATTPAIARARQDRPRTFETRHYRVWTDVELELAKDLCARLDAMYEEYARRFASIAPGNATNEKFDVRIFARRDDYVRFTQDRLPNSAGMFMPRRRLLAAFLEGHGRDGLRATLQHEAFHQFAHDAIAPDLPMWLNEGLAQVFEEAIWTGQAFMVGQVPPRRLRELQHDIEQGNLIDFRTMLSMGPRDWADSFTGGGGGTGTSSLYNQAWAMAHYLIYATDPDGRPLHRARVIDLLRRLKDGAKPDEAFRAAFSNNIEGFEARFTEHAATLEPTPLAKCIDNQTVLADMLVQLKQRGRTFDSIDAFRDHMRRHKLRLTYTINGAAAWETAADPTVYFNAPDGRVLGSRELFFAPRPGAPMPDLVCRAPDNLQVRTRFLDRAGTIERELHVEPRP